MTKKKEPGGIAPTETRVSERTMWATPTLKEGTGPKRALTRSSPTRKSAGPAANGLFGPTANELASGGRKLVLVSRIRRVGPELATSDAMEAVLFFADLDIA